MLLVTQKVMRILAVLLSCFICVVTRLRSLKKRKNIGPIKDQLLLLPATEIARKIRAREVRCEDVLQAYVNRCKEVNPILNAIVDERFEDAIQEAREVDELLKATGKTEKELASKFPLLGVPVTIKESIAVRGMSYATGVKRFASEKAQQDACAVEYIRKAGAIILLVSNTPELCLYWETYNKVTGRTNNPYDTNRVAGGSSGGECALLASAASVIGLGSDIAGSGRLPAMFCGVFGHKPSPGLVPCEGHRPQTTDVQWPSYFTFTPMTRYAEDIPLLLKVIAPSREATRRLDEKVSMRDIRFFYLENDASWITSPVSSEIKSAIYALKKYLETTYSVKVEQATALKELKYSFNIASSTLLKLHGVETVFKTKKGSQECDDVCLELLKFFFFMSSSTLPAILYGMVKNISEKLPDCYHAKMAQKREVLRKQFEDLLVDNGVLIYPTFVSTAFYHNETILNSQNFTYAMLYNVLGFPVTQCPMGLSKNGLPFGLQIVGLPGSDHLTIAVAREIQKAFGGWRDPSSVGATQTCP